MCECITKVNECLAEQNTQVTSTIGIVGGQLHWLGVRIETHKIDNHKRGKAVSLTAAHCPFCGEKYQNAAPDIAE